eukprot:gb/GECH01003966.1/.p1 GENE.gb/GECH01003966.1/~~gb/GECH01003966.1/.p1  ORF type:complete len:321 (+),score=72.80 gb/GECH01003966.1/:1-963(+)
MCPKQKRTFHRKPHSCSSIEILGRKSIPSNAKIQVLSSLLREEEPDVYGLEIPLRIKSRSTGEINDSSYLSIVVEPHEVYIKVTRGNYITSERFRTLRWVQKHIKAHIRATSLILEGTDYILRDIIDRLKKNSLPEEWKNDIIHRFALVRQSRSPISISLSPSMPLSLNHSSEFNSNENNNNDNINDNNMNIPSEMNHHRTSTFQGSNHNHRRTNNGIDVIPNLRNQLTSGRLKQIFEQSNFCVNIPLREMTGWQFCAAVHCNNRASMKQVRRIASALLSENRSLENRIPHNISAIVQKLDRESCDKAIECLRNVTKSSG